MWSTQKLKLDLSIENSNKFYIGGLCSLLKKNSFLIISLKSLCGFVVQYKLINK